MLGRRHIADQPLELRHIRGHQNQAFLPGTGLEPEQLPHRVFIPGIATETPDRLCRIGHNTAAGDNTGRLQQAKIGARQGSQPASWSCSAVFLS